MKNFRNGTNNAVRVVRVLISKSSPGFTRYFVESLGSARARLSLIKAFSFPELRSFWSAAGIEGRYFMYGDIYCTAFT